MELIKNWTIVKRKLKDIKPNKYCTRQEFDIEPLVDSFEEIGIEMLPGIDENNMLIFGERRIKALRQFDIKEIDIKLFKGLTEKQKIKMFYDENEIRKDYTPAEKEARLLKIWKSGLYETQKEMAKEFYISLEHLQRIFRAFKIREEIQKNVDMSPIKIDKISTEAMHNIGTLPIERKVKIVKDIIAKKQLTSGLNIRERVAKEKLEIKLKEEIFQKGLENERRERYFSLQNLITQREKTIIPSLKVDLKEHKLNYELTAKEFYKTYSNEINFPSNDADVVLTYLSEYHSNKKYTIQEKKIDSLKKQRKELEEKIGIINSKISSIYDEMDLETRNRKTDVDELISIDETITVIQNAIERERNNIIHYKEEMSKL